MRVANPIREHVSTLPSSNCNRSTLRAAREGCSLVIGQPPFFHDGKERAHTTEMVLRCGAERAERACLGCTSYSLAGNGVAHGLSPSTRAVPRGQDSTTIDVSPVLDSSPLQPRLTLRVSGATARDVPAAFVRSFAKSTAGKDVRAARWSEKAYFLSPNPK